MKYLLPPVPHLYCSILFLFSGLLLPAQVKTGFEQLKAEQPELATKSFEKCQSHKKWGAPAHYGMALIQMKYGTGISGYLAAYAYIEQAEESAKNLSFGKRRKLRKKEWLSGNLNSVEKAIQDSLAAHVARTEALSDIDSVLVFLEASRGRKLRGNAKRSFESTRQAVVARAVKHARDYATLHSLATRHRPIITQNSFLFADDRNCRLRRSRRK